MSLKKIVKILKINLTDDSYSIIKADEKELMANKGFQDKLSTWLYGFAVFKMVHEEDTQKYLKYTAIDFLRTYFDDGNKALNFHYRRKFDDEYKYVIMEI